MRSFIIHGVRKNKSSISPTAAQMMSLVDFEYYNSEHSELFRVKEIKVSVIHTHLTRDIRKMSMGLFMCELTKKGIHHFDQHDNIYQLLKDTLDHIEMSQTPWNAHIWYAVHLLEYLGIGFQIDNMPEDCFFDLVNGTMVTFRPAHNLYFDYEESVWHTKLKQNPLSVFDDYSMDSGTRYRLLEGVISYLREHGSHFHKFNSLEILRELFNS